jgi:hypothetical protein
MPVFALCPARGRLPAALMLATVALSLALAGCTARVHFSSTPAGAQVEEATLGPIGITPTERTLKPGTYSFVFRFPDGLETRVRREIRGPEAYVHAAPLLERTELRIDTAPPNARVQVTCRGRDVDFGQRPTPHSAWHLDDDALWQGVRQAEITVRVSAPGYTTIEEDIVLRRHTATVLSYALTERRARLHFTSEPPGADVRDRALGYLGRTPFFVDLSATELSRIAARRDQMAYREAQLQLTCEKDGYVPVDRVVWVRLGDEMNHIDFELSEK